MIGFQGLSEQAAAVERMLAQHALTPAVDGRDRGFIHPLRSDIEAIGTAGPLLRIELIAQVSDQSVRGRGLVAKKPRRLGQSRANSLAQLFGRRVGKRHHEDLRRQQLAGKPAQLTAVPEDEPQIERRNGEGFAGTGTRFD